MKMSVSKTKTLITQTTDLENAALKNTDLKNIVCILIEKIRFFLN